MLRRPPVRVADVTDTGDERHDEGDTVSRKGRKQENVPPVRRHRMRTKTHARGPPLMQGIARRWRRRPPLLAQTIEASDQRDLRGLGAAMLRQQ